MPKRDLSGVERELTGRETERWEIIYFKLYKSQIPFGFKRLAGPCC